MFNPRSSAGDAMMRELSEAEMMLVSGGKTKDPIKIGTGGGGGFGSGGWCQASDAMQTAGAAGAVFGAGVAGYGMLTGPGEAAFGPIGGGIALAGGAASGAGYLIGKAAGCP